MNTTGGPWFAEKSSSATWPRPAQDVWIIRRRVGDKGTVKKEASSPFPAFLWKSR